MNAQGIKISRDAPHRIDMIERKHLEVRGVTDVISFDENLVVLNTACGNMEIEGRELVIHVLNIDEGVVSLDGWVESLIYTKDPKAQEKKHPFLRGLLR